MYLAKQKTLLFIKFKNQESATFSLVGRNNGYIVKPMTQNYYVLTYY